MLCRPAAGITNGFCDQGDEDERTQRASRDDEVLIGGLDVEPHHLLAEPPDVMGAQDAYCVSTSVAPLALKDEVVGVGEALPEVKPDRVELEAVAVSLEKASPPAEAPAEEVEPAFEEAAAPPLPDERRPSRVLGKRWTVTVRKPPGGSWGLSIRTLNWGDGPEQLFVQALEEMSPFSDLGDKRLYARDVLCEVNGQIEAQGMITELKKAQVRVTVERPPGADEARAKAENKERAQALKKIQLEQIWDKVEGAFGSDTKAP